MKPGKILKGDRTYHYLKTCEGCNAEFYGPKRQRFCSVGCGTRYRSYNSMATGNTYSAHHKRVVKVRGRATKCVNGCLNKKKYEWANILGYYEDPWDYQEMCTSCHITFDKSKQHA